ncbi:MAG: hypothetical protein PHD06_05550 [Bacteroidales bacterium]|jgi:hypothetical protein|nr:hypothetical protein [Bacteroidales bacterium]MDD4384627.1 hypothetical protein [Bacteroidales bacterium]MDY0197129.1 hypothetical protein [Tenuifilaceae bacterium]
MVKSTNLKSLLERVNEIEKIVSRALQKDSLSAIEHDLLLEKLRLVYDELLFANNKEEKVESVKPKPIVIKEQVKPTKEVLEDVSPFEISVDDSSEIAITADDDREVIIQDETIQDEVDEDIPVIHHDLSTEKEQSIPLGDKYKNKQKFRNEILGQNKKDFATVLQNKAIGDLTKAIGINDKFLFTKELFNGNAEFYSKSINKLNEFTDINDALIYIQENFNWDNDNEAASQLIDLIRRKLLHG